MRDLMKAMSAHYYERTLPAELNEDEFVYLSLLYPDGKTRDLAGVNGFKPNEKVKIFVFLRSSDPYAIIMKYDGSSNTTANGLPEWKGYSTGHQEGQADDHMIRFNDKNGSVPPRYESLEEYDLIITTKKQ